MRPYSRKDLRGLAILALVCVLCISLGFVARRGVFGGVKSSDSAVTVKAATRDSIYDRADETNVTNKTKENKRNRANKSDKQSAKTKKKKTSKSRSVKEIQPPRDFLRDTIR